MIPKRSKKIPASELSELPTERERETQRDKVGEREKENEKECETEREKSEKVISLHSRPKGISFYFIYSNVVVNFVTKIHQIT